VTRRGARSTWSASRAHPDRPTQEGQRGNSSMSRRIAAHPLCAVRRSARGPRWNAAGGARVACRRGARKANGAGRRRSHVPLHRCQQDRCPAPALPPRSDSLGDRHAGTHRQPGVDRGCGGPGARHYPVRPRERHGSIDARGRTGGAAAAARGPLGRGWLPFLPRSWCRNHPRPERARKTRCPT
jgi:hypothetical protein